LNQMLRAKEAMQFDMLRGHEDSLSRMCSMLVELASRQDGGEGPDADNAVEVLSAFMLALRDSAQELLQQVRAPAAAKNRTSSDQTEQAFTPGDPISCNNSSSGRPMTPCCGRHMQRLWARITPRAVLEMRGITARQLAGGSTCTGCAGAGCVLQAQIPTGSSTVLLSADRAGAISCCAPKLDILP
jgi:hypothetical protein